jgi:hypothetical protein
MVTFWESEEAICAFAGDDITVAKYYDFDKDFLIELEPCSTHYEMPRHLQLGSGKSEQCFQLGNSKDRSAGHLSYHCIRKWHDTAQIIEIAG